MVLALLCFGFFGLFFGSFLNVVVDRLPRNESIVKGRSHCEACKKTLAWYDLIPVFSYLFLRGACRYCHARLSSYYLISELVTSLLFALTFWLLVHGDIRLTLSSINDYVIVLYHFVLLACLLIIFFIDLKFGIIPDKIVLPLAALTAIYVIVISPHVLTNHVLTAVGACVFFLIIVLATRGRGMGLGDVKFAFVMGLILGFPNIITALYIAFLTGALISLILVLTGKKRLKGGSIPFGPFLVLGLYLSIFLGETIQQLAMRILL